MSPARPPSSSRPPKASAYEVMTQVSAEGAMVKSRWMLGRAMFTMVPSRTTMSWAAAMTKIASPAWRSAGVVGAVSAEVVLLAYAMVSPGLKVAVVASPAEERRPSDANRAYGFAPRQTRDFADSRGDNRHRGSPP